MKNTADVTGDKHTAIAVRLLIAGVSAINLLVAFYDIHGRKGEVLFFHSVPDTIQNIHVYKSTFCARIEPTKRLPPNMSSNN
jgi:hypothetical protein